MKHFPINLLIGLLALLVVLLALAVKFTPPTTDQSPVHYEVNRTAYLRIRSEERRCMEFALSLSYRLDDLDNDGAVRDDLRSRVAECDYVAFGRLRFRDNPETFYVWAFDVDDPFYAYTECSNELSSPMWDFPPGTTAQKLRESLSSCIRLFPTIAQLRA